MVRKKQKDGLFKVYHCALLGLSRGYFGEKRASERQNRAFTGQKCTPGWHSYPKKGHCRQFLQHKTNKQSP